MYAYVGNDPVNGFDPTGLILPAAAIAAIAALVDAAGAAAAAISAAVAGLGTEVGIALVGLGIIAASGSTSVVGGASTAAIPAPTEQDECEEPDPDDCYQLATAFFHECFNEWSPVYGVVDAQLFCQEEAQALENFCLLWKGLL